jgi:hypothetical protein
VFLQFGDQERVRVACLLSYWQYYQPAHLPAAAVSLTSLQFGDQEGVRGVFVAMLELLKQRVGIIKGAAVTQQGNGTANTSLVYHAGRLLALHEGDLPYQVRWYFIVLKCELGITLCAVVRIVVAFSKQRV